MSTKQISDTIDALRTYGPGPARPSAGMLPPSRRPQQYIPPPSHDAHNSPRASYISLDDDTAFSGDMDRGMPRALPQAKRPNLRDASPSVMSFMSRNGFPPRNPAQNNTHNRGTPSSEVSLDRGYFNYHIPYPDHKEPSRYNGLSWHVKSMAPGGMKGIPERMSSRLSGPSVPATGDSDVPFIKGGSAFERSEIDLTIFQKARRLSLTLTLLGVAAAIFVIEECVVGAVWALVLSKRTNGMNRFAVGYFRSKAMNFIGSVVAALIGMGLQWVLHRHLIKSRITLQIWSFLLVFLTYMGCCIAAGVVNRIEG